MMSKKSTDGSWDGPKQRPVPCTSRSADELQVPGKGTDLLPPLILSPVTLLCPQPCLWGALGLGSG